MLSPRPKSLKSPELDDVFCECSKWVDSLDRSRASMKSSEAPKVTDLIAENLLGIVP